MSIDVQAAALGISKQVMERSSRFAAIVPGNVYVFSDNSYHKMGLERGAVFGGGVVSIGGSRSQLADIIDRELARPDTIGIATQSRAVFEHLLKSGTILGLGYTGHSYPAKDKVGELQEVTISTPAGDPTALQKVSAIAEAKDPITKGVLMQGVDLHDARAMPVYMISGVPEEIVNPTGFAAPNKPHFVFSSQQRNYQLFV